MHPAACLAPLPDPLILVVLLSAGVTGAYLIRGDALAFVNRLPVAAHTVAQAIQRASRGTPGTVSKVQAAARELESAASGATGKTAQAGVTAIRIQEPTFKWSDWLWQGSHGAMEFGGQMFAVLCLVYYLLAAGDLYKRKLVRMVPMLSDKKVTVEILDEIDRQIERFLVARVVISAIVVSRSGRRFTCSILKRPASGGSSLPCSLPSPSLDPRLWSWPPPSRHSCSSGR